MRVQFWGARGSVPVSGERFIKYGGNTTCVVFSHDNEHIIIDGGTGLKAFGDSLEGQPLDATFLFTHVHWDHIQGLPFFSAAFHPGSNIKVKGVSRDGWDFKNILSLQMTPPTFPVPIDILGGLKEIGEFKVDQSYEFGQFKIHGIDQNHPNGVVAYRVEAGGHSAVFATDVEHGGENLDQRLIELCQGVDLLIHDAQYTEDEYHGRSGPSRKGWGHSMWTEAVEIAQQSSVGRLALFHHDPSRSDEGIDQIEAESQRVFSGTFAAREGAIFDFSTHALYDAKGVEITFNEK